MSYAYLATGELSGVAHPRMFARGELLGVAHPYVFAWGELLGVAHPRMFARVSCPASLIRAGLHGVSGWA